MNKFEIAQQYANAIKQHQQLEQQLRLVVKMLDQDNELSIYGPVYQAYEELVTQLLGDNVMEHLLLWIYELDFGKGDTRTLKEYLESHQNLQ